MEIWKDIVGYEGLYEVSDCGRVKSLKQGKERILKPGRDRGGYLMVILYKNEERKMCKVHRLVCQAFISNPNNLPQVNHKDENKENNSVQNLEWCSNEYNHNYGTRNQRAAEKNTNGKLSKPVLQYSKSGEFVREWKSLSDVKRNLRFDQSTISKCCLGKLKSAYNYIWKYR